VNLASKGHNSNTLWLFKDPAKIQTNWRWFRRCCKSPKLCKNKGPFAKNCTKQIACLLKMIKVHCEITAWEWCTLQTTCNDRPNAKSEFLWITSTLSALRVCELKKLTDLNIKSSETKKLISRWICHRILATKIVFILILRHPCKCSRCKSFHSFGCPKTMKFRDLQGSISWEKLFMTVFDVFKIQEVQEVWQI
jgi:hypothetical protein